MPPPRPEWLKRAEVEQTVQLNFDSDNFLAGGDLDWLSHDAVVETLRPKEFVIDLQNPDSDAELPEDIQRVAQSIRDEGEPPQRFVESYISRMLPSDLVLNSVGFVANEHGQRRDVGAEPEHRAQGFRRTGYRVVEVRQPTAGESSLCNGFICIAGDG